MLYRSDKPKKDDKYYVFKTGEGFVNGHSFVTKSQSYTGKFSVTSEMIRLYSGSSGTSGTYNPTGYINKTIDVTDYNRLYLKLSAHNAKICVKLDASSSSADVYSYTEVSPTFMYDCIGTANDKRYSIATAAGDVDSSQYGVLMKGQYGMSYYDNVLLIDLRAFSGSKYIWIYGIGASQDNRITHIWLEK